MKKKVYVNKEAGKVITVIYKDGAVIGRSVATCHTEDVFDEEVGRNLSNVIAWKRAQVNIAKEAEQNIADIKEFITDLQAVVVKEEASRVQANSKAEELTKEQDALLATI